MYIGHLPIFVTCIS